MSSVTNISKIATPKEKGVCGFCSREVKGDIPLLKSQINNVHICANCVLASEQVAEITPRAALKCIFCKTIDGVKIIYDEAEIDWCFDGLDDYRMVVYIPISMEGKWTPNSAVHKVYCLKCTKELPLWILQQNPYAN